MNASQLVIIIKKKGGHGGHDVGAWKVAYADFVTAMMALFIVLWLLNCSKQGQEAVGGYFRDPAGTSKMAGTNLKGAGESFAVLKEDMPKLKEELQRRSSGSTTSTCSRIRSTVPAEGLRIELLEAEPGTFFESGSPVPSANGRELLIALAGELGKLPNKVSLEGHTDSKPCVGDTTYGNWELSADRANAARRLMQQNGVRGDQVMQVRGYADQRLRKPENPEDPSNRRISVIVENNGKDSEK